MMRKRGTGAPEEKYDTARVDAEGSYHGGASDYPVPGDYDGDLVDDPSIFRESFGLWAINGITRVYFGRTGDIPATR
jgi:hypothetical protein